VTQLTDPKPASQETRASHTASQTDRGHGRVEQRWIEVIDTSPAQVGFPHAAQAWCVVREVFDLDGSVRSCETVYGLTSASARKAGPGRLLDLTRGQWSIENGLHWVRDVTLKRGPLSSPDRVRPTGDDHPTQPRDRRAAPGGRDQHRSGVALGRAQPSPSVGVAGTVNPLPPCKHATVGQVCPGAPIYVSNTASVPAANRHTAVLTGLRHLNSAHARIDDSVRPRAPPDFADRPALAPRR